MNNRITESNSEFRVSDIIKAFMAFVTMILVADLVLRLTSSASATPADTTLTQYIQSQTYVGVSDPRVVAATSVLSYLDLVGGHPYTPWVSVNFINDGPDPVKIAINYPAALYELLADEAASVYRIGAQERIAVIFFVCERGERASLRVIGEY